jgi:hypothetical protein
MLLIHLASNHFSVGVERHRASYVPKRAVALCGELGFELSHLRIVSSSRRSVIV